jgi:hypothetical protein
LTSIATTDANLKKELTALERQLYATTTASAAWSGDSLAAATAHARKTILMSHHDREPSALPALNP